MHSSRVRDEAREPAIRTATSHVTPTQRCGDRRGRARGGAIVLLSIVVLTACGAHSPRPAVPPVAFAPGVVLAPAVAAPPGQNPYQRRLPVALVGSNAYLAGPGSVQISDARTGRTTATVRPRRAPITGAGPLLGAPKVSTLNNTQVVLWPFLVESPPVNYPPPAGAAPSGTPQAGLPGLGAAGPPAGNVPLPTDAAPQDNAAPTDSAQPSGSAAPPASTAAAGPTPPPGTSVELDAIRTDDHSTSGVLVSLPDWASGSSSNVSVSVVGAVSSTVVLDVTDGLSDTAVVVDAKTGSTLWTRDNFAAGAVTDQTVVGTEADTAQGAAAQHVAALSLADGQPRWTQLHGYGLRVSPAGPTLVAAIAQRDRDTQRGSFQLLNAASGAPVATLAVPSALSSRCDYDGISVTVCYAPESRQQDRFAVGVDARTGKQLWAMPDYSTSSKPAPLVTALWHGMIYATPSPPNVPAIPRSGGPPPPSTEVYQASTGILVRSSPGPAPLVVDDNAAVSLDTDNTHVMARQPVA